MIVLASTSPTRRTLLRRAGLHFKTARPPVDEAAITAKLRSSGASAREVALKLAETKAMSVGRVLPGAFVIGADQMLECDGDWFTKPTDAKIAKEQLRSLRGRTHTLVTAVALTNGGNMLWSHAERADMTMRPFTDGFLDSYLESLTEDTLTSVGGYQLEGLGVQLFDDIKGDYFSILGLPLLPLLAALRQAGALTA